MRGISTNVSRLAAQAVALLAAALTLAALAAPPATARPPSYTIWTVAGNFTECSAPPACGGGHPAAEAQLSFPQAVAVAASGNVYIADWGDNEVRRLMPNGAMRVIAGTGTFCQNPPRCGDGGPATAARLNFPAGVAVDSAGNVYVADTQDNEVRKISPAGKITRVAGTGSPCAKPPACGDRGAATAATLRDPTGLAVDRAGNLYISDTGDQEIRKVSRSGKITRVAGTGRACTHPSSCGDSGAARKARLSFPAAVAVGGGGVLYIADSGDQEIRKVSAAGTITTVAGSGVACSSPPSCGDGGPATKAQLSYPGGVAVGPGGTLLIADSSDNELRLLSAGKITRLAGTGAPCSTAPCGDNLAASAARLNYPDSVAVDGHGTIYVADAGDNAIRWLARGRVGHVSTPGGWVGLTAFSTTVTKRSVVVRFVIGRAANIELTVRHSGHSQTAATSRAHPGFNLVRWNRRFRGKTAGSGRYKLVVSAAIGRRSTSTAVHVKL